MYPNPVTDNLQISFNADSRQLITFQISDLYGRIVFTRNEIVDENTINLSYKINHLAAEIYMLRILNSNNEVKASSQFVKK